MSSSASLTDTGIIVVWFTWMETAVAIEASLNILLSDHVARLMHDGMDEESEPNTWLFQILSSKTTKKITACRYYFCIQDCI